MQATVGMTGLPTGGEITWICRVFEKTRQLRPYALGTGLIRQPDVALVMLLNREDNTLRRHVINKRLRHAGLAKEVIINIVAVAYSHKGDSIKRYAPYATSAGNCRCQASKPPSML